MTETDAQSVEQNAKGGATVSGLIVLGVLLIALGVIVGFVTLGVSLMGTKEFIFLEGRYRAGFEFARLLQAVWVTLAHIVPGFICLGMARIIMRLEESR